MDFINYVLIFKPLLNIFMNKTIHDKIISKVPSGNGENMYFSTKDYRKFMTNRRERRIRMQSSISGPKEIKYKDQNEEAAIAHQEIVW